MAESRSIPAAGAVSGAVATPGAALDAAGLALFYHRCGVRVAESPSAWWMEAAPRFLLAIPTHRQIALPADEAAALIRSERLAGLRYMAADSDGGRESFHLVCDTPDFAIEKLSANTRSRVRRGLSRNEIRRITGAELSQIAERAFVETMERQNRASTEAVQAWRRMLAAVDTEPAIEVWTAWHEGQFASYLITVRIDDTCEFLQARSSTELLKHYPNNALVYSLTEEMLVRRGVREITFGIESPEPLDDLDTFKLQMGFRKKPVRQRVVFSPMLRAALSLPPVRKIIVALGSRPGANVRLRKAAGILRFADGGNA